MSESDVNTLLIRLGVLEATVTGKLDAIASENNKADALHADHELRIRGLESALNKSRGAWGLLTAGGCVGAVVATVVLRFIGV